MHNETFEVGNHCQQHPLNYCSCKFEVSSCRDINRNTHGPTVLTFEENMKHFPYTHRLSINIDHDHNIRRVPWPLTARARAVVNVLVEMKLKARDRQYNKLK